MGNQLSPAGLGSETQTPASFAGAPDVSRHWTFFFFNHILNHIRIMMLSPIGSMYGIYTNIGAILMGSMLPYIAAP